MAIIKNTASKLKTTAKRMFAAKELQQGFNENYGVIKKICSYNLKKFTPDYDHFSMPTAQYIEIQKGFRKILFLFIFILAFAMLYAFINLIKGHYTLFFLSLSFSFLCLIFTFRYHFWLYQMKRKKLGCTFTEWYRDEVKVRLSKTTKAPSFGAKK